MKNNNDIESFLRENRPQVEDNPAFLLEVQQKMRTVEGIKSEVDRQRNYGRTALVCALVLGMLAGALAMLLAYMYPVDTEAISDGVISAIRLFIDPWKQYLMIPVAVCAVALSVLLGAGGRKTAGI